MLTSQHRPSTVLLLLFASACDDPAEPPPPPVTTLQHASPATPVEAEAAEIDTYAYTSIGKRDPFRSAFSDVLEKPEPSTALQRWNLDELKLIAVITGTPAPYAMIEDPTGKGHVVRRGSLIGRNFGRVRMIREDEILIREEYRSYTGAKIFNDITFAIKPPKLELGDEI